MTYLPVPVHLADPGASTSIFFKFEADHNLFLSSFWWQLTCPGCGTLHVRYRLNSKTSTNGVAFSLPWCRIYFMVRSPTEQEFNVHPGGYWVWWTLALLNDGGYCVIRISQWTPHSSTITTAIPSYKFSFPFPPHVEKIFQEDPRGNLSSTSSFTGKLLVT